MHFQTLLAPTATRRARLPRALTLMVSWLLILPFWLSAQGQETRFGNNSSVAPHATPAPAEPVAPIPPPPPAFPSPANEATATPAESTPAAGGPSTVTSTPATAPKVLYEGEPAPQPVSKTGGAALPATGSEALPTTAPEGPRATLLVKQMDIDQVFNRLHDQTGVRVKAMGATKGQKLDLTARDQAVEEILNQIAVPRQWIWIQRPDGAYEMYDKDTYVRQVQSQQVIRQIFQLRYIDAEEMQKVVQPILTPEIGAVAADARSNKLIVTDLPSKVALVQSIIQEYDVQLYTRVFEIKNAKTEDLAERLDEVKSKSAEIQVDPATHLIIVRDTFDKIKIMEQLVELLDRDQEMRVYNMNNIGLDGEVAEDFIDKFIKPLTTQEDNAVLEFNKETAKLFVRDIRPVHEKILQVLRQVDVPRKQVLIEGEIVSVSVNNKFKFGTEWTLSGDLNGAVRAGQPGTAPFNTPSTDGSSGSGAGTPTLNNYKSGLPLITGGSGGLRIIDMNDKLKADITASLTNSKARLLLQPRLIIANNEEGNFEVTTNEPILQTYFNNNSVGSNTFQSSGQSLVSTGLKVNLTPHISNRGLIEMEVRFENSTPNIVPDLGNGTRGVGSFEQSAETFMIVPSGQTRVIGGLITHDRSEGNTGIPILANLPYLGFLFGSRTKDDNLRNLMFFITSTIVDESPLNDIVEEPVNEQAKASIEEAKRTSAAAAPENVNQIPQELVPYLKQIQPEAVPMPAEGDTGTTGTMFRSDVPTTGSLRMDLNELTTATQLLSNEPFIDKQGVPALKIGGAVQSLQAGATGPTGVFGATAGGGKGKAARGTASSGKATATTGKAAATTGKATSGSKPAREKTSSRDRTSSRRSTTSGQSGTTSGSTSSDQQRISPTPQPNTAGTIPSP